MQMIVGGRLDELKKQINEREASLQSKASGAIQDAMEIGRMLCEAASEIGYTPKVGRTASGRKEFFDWVTANTSLGTQTILRYMKAYKAIGGLNLDRVPPKVFWVAVQSKQRCELLKRAVSEGKEISFACIDFRERKQTCEIGTVGENGGLKISSKKLIGMTDSSPSSVAKFYISKSKDRSATAAGLRAIADMVERGSAELIPTYPESYRQEIASLKAAIPERNLTIDQVYPAVVDRCKELGLIPCSKEELDKHLYDGPTLAAGTNLTERIEAGCCD